jgi:hypothetical protein
MPFVRGRKSICSRIKTKHNLTIDLNLGIFEFKIPVVDKPSQLIKGQGKQKP